MDLQWNYLVFCVFTFSILTSTSAITESEDAMRSVLLWTLKPSGNLVRCQSKSNKTEIGKKWIFNHVEMGVSQFSFNEIITINHILANICMGKVICDFDILKKNVEGLFSPGKREEFSITCIEVRTDVCKRCNDSDAPVILSDRHGYLTNMPSCNCNLRINVQSNEFVQLAYENAIGNKDLCFPFSVVNRNYRIINSNTGYVPVITTSGISSSGGNTSCLIYNRLLARYPTGMRIEFNMNDKNMIVNNTIMRYVLYYRINTDSTLRVPDICSSIAKKSSSLIYKEVFVGEYYKVDCKPPKVGASGMLTCKGNNKWDYSKLPTCVEVTTVAPVVNRGEISSSDKHTNISSVTLGVVITIIVMISMGAVCLFVYMVAKFIHIKRSEQPCDPLMDSKASTTSMLRARYDRNNSVDMRDRPLPMIPLVRTLSDQTDNEEGNSVPNHRYYDLDADPITPKINSNEEYEYSENIGPVSESIPMTSQTVRNAVNSCMTADSPTPLMKKAKPKAKLSNGRASIHGLGTKESPIAPDVTSISSDDPPTSVEQYRRSVKERRRSFAGILSSRENSVEEKTQDNLKSLKSNGISILSLNEDESESGYSEDDNALKL